METTAILSLIWTVVGVLVAVVGIGLAVVLTVYAIRRQERQAQEHAEEDKKRAREKEIREISQNLSDHLTAWIAALRDAVRRNDSQTLGEIKRELQYFKDGRTYEGPLHLIFSDLSRYPEFSEVEKALEIFRGMILDFKEGAIVSLDRMIAERGDWTEDEYITEKNDFERRKEIELKMVTNAYDAIMNGLGRVLM